MAGSTDPRRELPARARLGCLKQAAQPLHREMQAEDPQVQLSAAQNLMARRYGFSSWRRLHAYVRAMHEFGEDLGRAVRTGDEARAAAILSTCPELANAPVELDPHVLRPSDAQTMRLLHLAVAEGQTGVISVLIAHGADLNARNADGRTPLHDCFELGRDDLAKGLMEAGAQPDVCLAAAWGLNDKLVELLKRDPVQANDLSTGMSPLGWSAYGGDQTASAEILFRYGAIADRPPYDWAAWDPAAHVANLAAARVLLVHGASPDAKAPNSGDRPLHRVITSQLVADPSDFVSLLLEAGADPLARNHAGRTPLEEAIAQVGVDAQTYYPVRPLRPKELTRTIALLKAAS